ncbi:MAG: hypothetical protein IJ711_07815 [Lachnospiraceae bacterium]|nr:hypothetical protein [Lachnospiraceae bacterium]
MKINRRFLGCLSMVVILSCFAGQTLSLKAASLFSNSTTKKQLFAVPEGGWSSINVKVDYIERYSSSGNNNTLNHRSKCVSYARAYATSCPTVSVGNVAHSNGKSFTSWTKEAVMYDGSVWDGCSYWSNYGSVTYSKTTSVTGNLPFILSCDGAVPASSSGSVQLAFK